MVPARFITATLSCALFGTVLSARPADAQGPIPAGQTVSGRLDGNDYLRDDGTYYDDWVFDGRAGEVITVTQSSSDFDSWLLLGRVVGGEFKLDEFDDDGAGGNDAQITYTLPADGRYVIRVNVVGRGRTGAYTLRLDRTGAPISASRPVGNRVLTAGQVFTGELDASDPVWTDETYYELWRYYGRAGERIVVTMRSPSFNSYMQYGRLNGGQLEYIGGSQSRTVGGQHETVLDVTLPATGEYGIRANSHGRHTGRYTISVTSNMPATVGPAVTPTRSALAITIGSTIRQSLQEGDLQADSGWYHDDYTFSGSRGDVVTIDMTSSDFDAYLDVYNGSNRIAADDDGGDGLNARVVVTLPETGTFTICARSRYANRTGSYTLTTRSGAGQTGAQISAQGGTSAGAGPRYVGVNQTVAGQLDSSDPTMGDGTYYELWRFSGQAGQRVRITMRSSAFDAYMTIGTFGNDTYSYIRGDDDGAGGNDAMIEYTLPSSGEYAIRANSMGRATGRYTITLQTY